MIPTLCVAATLLTTPAGPPTQIDLARAYLAFEHAVRANPPTRDQLAAVNRAADAVAWKFLSGQTIDAIRELNEIRLDLETEGDVSDAQRLAASIAMDTPTFPDRGLPRGIRLRSLYPAPIAEPVHLTLLVDRAAEENAPPGDLLDTQMLTIGPDDAMPLDLVVPVSWGVRRSGNVRCRLVIDESGAAMVIGSFRAWPSRVEEFVRVHADLASSAPEAPEAARRLFERRLNLLVDPGHELSRYTLGDSLWSQLASESHALANGEDPYLDRRGDIWHEFSINGAMVPCRVYAPTSLDGPAPVVLAFHGAGGNEHLFMDGYGAGLLRELADRHGFIAVSPSTYTLIGAPGLLPGLIDQIDRLYDVDRSRVSAIGHSLGAMLASSLAWQQPDVLSAVCAIAGGRPPRPGTPMAPLLIVGAELDRIIPAEPLRKAAEHAAANNMPVAYREAKDIGHVLVVAATLEECVAWVLGANDEEAK